MQNIFSIDGKFYDVEIPEEGIKRSFSVLDSEKSKRVQSGDMRRSIIGTFYNYTIQIGTSNLNKEEYDELYEIISAPEEFHKIMLPYGQDILKFDAYVTGGEDTLKIVTKDGNVWSGLSVNFIAKSPKRKSL